MSDGRLRRSADATTVASVSGVAVEVAGHRSKRKAVPGAMLVVDGAKTGPTPAQVRFARRMIVTDFVRIAVSVRHHSVT